MYGKACGFETIRPVPEEFRVREICEVKLARYVRQDLRLRGIGEASANTSLALGVGICDDTQQQPEAAARAISQRGQIQRGSCLWTSRSIRRVGVCRRS